MTFKILMFVVVASTMAVLVAAQHDHLVGGVGTISPDDEGMQKVLKSAVHLYNNQKHDGMTNHLKLGQVRSAKKQVVSGVKYEVEFDLLPTTCAKSGNISKENLEKCSYDESKMQDNIILSAMESGGTSDDWCAIMYKPILVLIETEI